MTRAYLYRIQSLLLLGAIIMCGALLPSALQAAEFYFGAPAANVGVSDVFEVGVFLNTDGAVINALEGKIVFPSKTFLLKDIRVGDSLISYWIEHPRTAADGNIMFSGVIPGGVETARGYLFSLILEPIAVGRGTLTTRDEQILLHDGRATPTFIRRAPLTFQIGATPTLEPYLPPLDETVPEEFVPAIGADPLIFDGKPFVAFATQDKGSGIDHYEIARSQRAISPDSPALFWKTIESPYLLSRSERQGYLYIKAVDKSGNERVVVIPPSERKDPLVGYAAAAIAACVVIFVFLLNRRRKKTPGTLS